MRYYQVRALKINVYREVFVADGWERGIIYYYVDVCSEIFP